MAYKQHKFTLTVVGAGKSQDQGACMLSSGEGPLPRFIDGAFSLCPHTVEGGTELCGLCYKSTNPVPEGFMTSQRPYLPILSSLGVQISAYEILGGHKH